jgi:hypothetical protein
LNSNATAISASGGLMANTHCQPNDSVSQPPSTGPPAVVSAEAAAHTPMARLRSFFGKVAPISARLDGVRMAADTPCTTRHTISHSTDGATMQAADAKPKPRQPTPSMRALP